MAHPLKSCGGCTLCCKTMAVVELQKAEHVWCEHCEIGNTCRIYADRPKSCRDFECQWLLASPAVLGDDFRPDRIKVVLAASGDGKVIAHCDPDRPMAWRSSKMLPRLRQAAKQYGHSIVRAGDRYWIVTADAECDVPPRFIIRRADGRTDVMVPYVGGMPALHLFV